jgi:putative addiction module killer protein
VKIRRTDVFINWFKKLKDRIGKSLIAARISRLEEGNPGDNRFLGDIVEMRINYGPGYRVYYKTTCRCQTTTDCQDSGKEIIILLCGGDKSTQERDIARAREIAQMPLKEEKDEEK